LREIKENSIYFFFRRGKKEHIASMYEKGEIYLNTIDFIRNCDENMERSDPEDGIFERKFLGDAKIKFCDVGKDIDKEGIEINGKDLIFQTDTTEKGNIFCLSAIKTKHIVSKPKNIEFDTNSFGESLILIHNPKEFILRVENELKKNGFEKIYYKSVNYYESEYSGKVGVFRKHIKFKKQNEFRFYIPNKENIAIKINIGSMKDIAMIENNRLLRIEFTNNSEKLIKL
jgi:hypothetical protein